MQDPALETEKWLRHTVIGLELCPFAKEPMEKGLIRIVSCPDSKARERATFFLDELEKILEAKASEISTTLIAYPRAEKTFRAFLNFTASLDELLKAAQALELFQLVAFHPKFLMKRLAAQNVGNNVGRSPYPTIHILRADELALITDGKAISLANSIKLKMMNKEEVKRGFPHII